MTEKIIPSDGNEAKRQALASVFTMTSKLSPENCQRIMGEIAGSLLSFLPLVKIDEIAANAKKHRERNMEVFRSLDNDMIEMISSAFSPHLCFYEDDVEKEHEDC